MAKEKKSTLDRGAQLRVLRRVLHELKPQRWALAGSLALALAVVALTLYVPVQIGNAVDMILGPDNVDVAGIVAILVRVAFIIAATALFQWLLNIINNRMTYGVVRSLREQAFSKLQILPLSYLDSHPVGDTVSRVIADVDQFADGLLMGFTQLFTGVMTIVGTLAFMAAIDVGVTLVVVLVTPLSFFVASFISKRTYEMFRLQTVARGEQTAFIDEVISSQKVVQAFSQEDNVTKRFDGMNERLASHSLRATFFSSLTNPCTRFVNSVAYALVALTGALASIGGGLTVGLLTCLLSYANQYAKPFNEISGVVTELQGALACAKRIFEIIDEQPQLPDVPDARELTDVKGNVALSNVAFSYVKDRPLIEDLSLRVQPGQRVAIVGPTGCGKTTLINLLMRFYDIDGGVISVDGLDIRDVTRASLRGSYGMVLQETWLRAGTIRDNLKLGYPDATDEEMIEAARAAHAHGFISRLPQGYDTPIGEDGGNLSQGQKQLLCIARVMLCLPPMLILDEATSSIDTRTELKIQEAFARMMLGRTSFIVAHRLSTIQSADVILVMRDGHIIEQGNHGSLLAKGGFYADLYNSQFAR